MPAGRPLKFATPQDMQSAVDAYFASRDENNRPTVTGLALALGFCDRSSLIDYEERDQFFHTIKAAKARVQEFIENRLYDPNATGCIFNLKNNFGWRDKSEQELTGADGGPVELSVTRRILKAE